MKAVSEYLGHHSPDFTEDVYVHQEEAVYDCSSLNEEWEWMMAPDREEQKQQESVLRLPFEEEDLLLLLHKEA